VPHDFHDPVRSTAPALLLSGEHDPTNPPEWGEAAARHLPRARHVVLPGAAHGPSYPGCAQQLVAAFIAAGSADGLDTECLAALPARTFAPAAPRPSPRDP
jgi:pimeloyl-ACP methyl ester carboxylesterase